VAEKEYPVGPTVIFGIAIGDLESAALALTTSAEDALSATTAIKATILRYMFLPPDCKKAGEVIPNLAGLYFYFTVTVDE
jgi:hypothetical protein